MAKVLRVQCRTELPIGMGFIDEGVMYQFVYVLATKMTPRQLNHCIGTYWDGTEVTKWEIVSCELVDEPKDLHVVSYGTNTATFDGRYGVGFPIVDNGIARRILYIIRQSSWSGKGHTAFKCEVYNWATKPSRLMTNKESKACQHLARLAKKKLTPGNYKENEDGTLVSLM